MKKSVIIFTNILIMASILAFVIYYNGKKQNELIDSQIEAFEDMTLVLSQVTANYLQGEQRICDVWANYINASGLTMEEAVNYIRVSHVRPDTSAHLIYTDDGSFSGLSTRPRAGTEDDYVVSYAGVNLWQEAVLHNEVGDGIHITRAYTNPLNGEQALAFYNSITLTDESSGSSRDALLLRVIPVSKLEDGWVFPKEDYKSAELTMINAEGSYIIKGKSFKNTSFLEFYKSYTSTDPAALQYVTRELSMPSGTFTMNNSRGEECLIAHAQIRQTTEWNIISYVTLSELEGTQVDWPLIIPVGAALLLLFLLDMAYMMKFNRRLAHVAREAETASRAKTDFLSAMSHDIRTPMNAIIGLTAITEKNVEDPQLVSENLRKISMASNHLLTLINDILDISKVESGKLNLSPVNFSIVETAENLVNLSQPMVKEKKIDFSFHIRNMEKEYLNADQLRINQIFINILSNAIKYTEPGGSVKVSMEERSMDQEGSVELIYQVADTGIGMSKEYMERMYQPFSRQTDSRVNTIQGTGLGLAITRQMVDLMDGRIECESEEGKGTTFTVYLTLPVAEQQIEEADLENVDVLLVDDDEILLETGQETLRSLNALTETAASGEEAIRMITGRHQLGKDYDLVILDWKMPGMDGLDVVRALREKMQFKVPILLISSYDWSDIEEEAKKAGVNGFIGKPLFRSRLYDKISEVLGRKKESVLPEDDLSDIRGMKILVAEDNEINWEIIHALLEMYGIDSFRAPNGQIAVQMLMDAPRDSYDLVFMDIQMPVMNGLDAARAIRALENSWACDIPIIAMTADAFSENVSECMAAGMNGHIAKPIDTKLVLKEIRNIRIRQQSKR